MYIDSHAHLTSDALYPDLEDYLKRAQEAHVDSIINICTDLETLYRGFELQQEYPWVFNAGATTPHDVEKEGEAFFREFEKAAEEKRLVAIGETGLDYHYDHSPKETQQDFFKRYLELALRCKLPVIIHCRDAFDDFFKIIESHYHPKATGVLHCFTGSIEDARELVKRNWMISFSGIITFKKSEALREVVKEVPIESLLIETDAPYLAPQSKRGKANEPAFVVEVAQMVAQVKGLTLKEVADATKLNACRLFQIPYE